MSEESFESLDQYMLSNFLSISPDLIGGREIKEARISGHSISIFNPHREEELQQLKSSLPSDAVIVLQSDDKPLQWIKGFDAFNIAFCAASFERK